MSLQQQNTEQPKSSILIVDDEMEIRQMVAICLQKFGYNTCCADSADSACKLLVLDSYDAILTDVVMPGEDGISLLGRVHDTWPDIPVIIMTGHAQLQMAVNAIKKGAFDFVYKPFDFDHLRKIVVRAVNYTKLQRMEKNYHAELEETVTKRTAELKDAMVELDFARSALLRSATEKNEFMSNISHEMRTPMNGVMGGLELLADEVITVAGKEYLDIVRESADNMVALVDQLLVFGKGIGSSGVAACYDLICLETVLNAVVAEYRSAFVSKGISLTLRVASDVPREIWTDKEHLHRLFEILIGNALKFTDKGGVTLEVFHEDNNDQGSRLFFSVIDSGIGIPKGMLDRIFEPFVQGDGSHTRRHGGVGLGLAIAQQNALILNGRLWAEHVPEGGSNFRFTMKVVNYAAS